MRGGRPATVLLAAASMAVAGMGVHLGNNVLAVDEDFPPRRRRIAPTRRYCSGGGPWPVNGEREIARRLRQQSRDAYNRGARAEAVGSPSLGISRRGNAIV